MISDPVSGDRNLSREHGRTRTREHPAENSEQAKLFDADAAKDSRAFL